jgi:hypothetical protein
MDQKLTDGIAGAKRELRKRSGESTSDDQEAEREAAAIDAAAIDSVEDWMFRKFEAHVLLALGAEVIWTGTEPLIQFTVDGHIFNLLKDGETYPLIHDGKTLTTIPADDPEFANRVIVAVGGVVEG